MTVYVDVMFALNAAADYLLLLGAARLGGGKILQRRLIPAALLGGAYAAAALFPALGFLQSTAMKPVVLVLMLLLAFGWQRRTVRLGVLFAALSLGFAGAALLFGTLFGADVLLYGGSIYYPVSFWGLLLLAGVLYFAATLGFSRASEHSGSQIVPLELRLGGQSVQLRALRDTGNTLRDPITNERVLVTGWQTAALLLPNAGLRQTDFLHPAELLPRLRKDAPALRPRLIPYRAVGTSCGMLAAFRCEVGGSGSVLVAFSPTPVSDGGNFDALTGG